MSEYLLELKGVCKSFPGVKALDNVQLALRPGTVHALMGKTERKIDIDEMSVRYLQDGCRRNIYEWAEDPGRQSG